MRNSVWPSLLLCLLCFSAASVAQDLSREEMRSLDEQVQEIKSDVLAIAADLSRLEERLIYPSGTQVAVFVSMAEGQKFRLDALQVRIDGELATHYIYSFKELDALQNGGVQRVYIGNLPTGAHQLEVSVSGKTEGGRDFSGAESHAFSKGVEPAMLGVTLIGPDSIRIENW
jgi:hypothetical protein